MTDKKNTVAPFDAASGAHGLDITIDWAALVAEVDGVRGISLRKLVEDGELYSRMDHAVRSLESSGIDFSRVKGKSGGGRPKEDYLLSFESAVEFAAKANTAVGRQVMQMLIKHHDLINRYMAGDKPELRRLAEKVSGKQLEDAPAPTRPRSGASIRAETSDREARLRALREYRDEHGAEWTDAYRRHYDHQIAELGSGLSLPKPALITAERWYLAGEAGKHLGGLTANKVGRIANTLGLKGDDRYTRGDMSEVGNGTTRQVWRYNDAAVALMREHLSRN